jgi:hypothetical protein
MKRRSLLAVCLTLATATQAQLNIQSGASFFIDLGATVSVIGNVTSQSNITGSGTLQMKGTAAQSIDLGGNTIPNLQIDNASNVSMSSDATIGSNLDFVNGKLLLATASMTLADAAGISGYSSSSYLVTGGSGQVIKDNLGSTAFTFPVGFDINTYNPVTITQNGTAENLGIRCLEKVLNAGTSGTPFVKEVVDASWVLTESTAGENDLSISSSWTETDELTGFKRTKTGLSHYDGSTWDMTSANTGAAAGSGPYTITRNNITTVGAFAVGTRPVLSPLLVAPKVFLQGAYNASTGLMTDKLRSSGLIPTTEPYTGMTSFTHSGSGGGETIPSSVLAGTGTGSDIVDWVFLELRDAGTSAVLATRAALLQRDGQIVDVDGTNTKTPYVNFAGQLPGNYYISVRHRNHLGVRSASVAALDKTTATAYDFTTAQTQAYQNSSITTNSAMANNGAVYMMWAGNANQDKYVRYTSQAFPFVGSDAASIVQNFLNGDLNATLSTYNSGDVNMDGKTRATSQAFPFIPSDKAFILSSVLVGDINASRREHN